jgi:ComF family protein
VRNVWSTYLQHIKHNVSFIDRILAILAPNDCLSCGIEGNLLCKGCVTALPAVAPKQLAGPDLELVRSATTYEGSAKNLIWQLKSSGAQEAARLMAKRMATLIPMHGKYLIVPVPTATSRIRQRGYDQALLLAKEISRQSRLPWSKVLVRHGQAHQVGADREQRIYQLTTAFRVKKPRMVNGAHIILIDDVVTTGATLETAAKILKQAGARHVDAITFAQPQLRIKQLHSRGW